MDIVTFRTFLAAAATGTFSGAAQQVNASPSSVTERIKQLENRLGVRLFIRDKRGCQLTAEGKRFMEPARQAVRAWEVAKHDIGLPERYRRSLSFGGQYFLWDGGLMEWLAKARTALPDVSFRTTAGAWLRLNRDLGEGALDMVVLHDPIFRRGIQADRIFDDRLILVGACDPVDWAKRYVRIEWGHRLGTEIAARVGVRPQEGLTLDLGLRSANWLISQKMAGFMPEHAVSGLLEDGQLTRIDDTPDFDFPAYFCWREDVEPALAEDVRKSLRTFFNSD